jgi:ubiquinone/menaquinone biosynthesis C-methylase UbiE
LEEVLTDAERWEAGCDRDDVRNKFVIPVVGQMFNVLRPNSVLDVGAATGFTARHIDSQLNYRPNWCLLDSSSERLTLASDKCPSTMNAEVVCDDFLNSKAIERKFDALFFGFTLLELGTGDEVLSRIDSLCAKRGVVVIAQPDVMQDVLANDGSNSNLVQKFVAGPVNLRKTDKFTHTEYPFHAERFESVTYKVMRLGFSLERFEKEVFDGRAVFLLAFTRLN